jgi:3-hydroxyisobutyrate dehydrogenase
MTAATVAMADALEASDRLGVPREALLDVLADGPLGVPYALQKAQLMTAHEYTPGFSVELALKDSRLMERTGESAPLLEALDQRLASAVRNGHVHDDLAAVAAPD